MIGRIYRQGDMVAILVAVDLATGMALLAGTWYALVDGHPAGWRLMEVQ